MRTEPLQPEGGPSTGGSVTIVVWSWYCGGQLGMMDQRGARMVGDSIDATGA